MCSILSDRLISNLANWFLIYNVVDLLAQLKNHIQTLYTCIRVFATLRDKNPLDAVEWGEENKTESEGFKIYCFNRSDGCYFSILCFDEGEK